MTLLVPVEKARPARAETIPAWGPNLAALAVSAAVIVVLFARDAAGMASIWWNASTFNHCLLILPIILWLVWQRLPQLRQIQPQGWSPGLVIVAAGAIAWLLGEAGGLALARHAGLVVMLQGAVVTCLGKAVARALLFPIFYALFLIPAGEELVPPMQILTAEMCMALLGLFGVPAYLDGIFITTPTGYFEVAEACSGVKFLIAMVAYGALVANVCFRSWTRRAIFVAAAILIPVLANGVRAWGTIYVAHVTGDAEVAAGFDHVFYGWIFFAIVISLLMAAGWRFFDRRPSDPWFEPRLLQPVRPEPDSGKRIAGIAAAAIALAALPVAWSAAATARVSPLPPVWSFPEIAGWAKVETPKERMWRPQFSGADRLLVQRYRAVTGHEVDLAIALFARQEEGREIVGFGQGPVTPEQGWTWTGTAAPPPGGRADRLAGFGRGREVVTFYRVGDALTGSRMDVKLETMKSRLFGGSGKAAVVLVSAETPLGGGDPRLAIDAFLGALGPVAPFADRAMGLR